jgi:putative inorganic carbon (HCO3(-)) transporter
VRLDKNFHKQYFARFITSYQELIFILIGVLFSLFIATQSLTMIMAGLFMLLVGIGVIVNPLASLAILLIFSPARALINTEAPTLLPFDIGLLLFALFMLMWGFHQAYLGKRPAYRHHLRLMFPLIAFISIITLTGFVADNLSAWLNEWIKWLIIALTVFYVLENKQHRQIIALLLLVSAFGHAVVGIYTFLGGSGADHLRISERFFRAFGTFGQPNPFGGFMGLIAPLGIMLGLAQIRDFIKKPTRFTALKFGILGIMTVIIILALFASWSRGAWLGFVASVGIMLVALPRKFWQSVALFIIGIIFVIGLAYVNVLPSSITNRLQSITQEMFSSADVRGVYITSENYAVIERLAHWQAALNMAEANPILGVGMGNYDSAYDTYRLLNWEMSLSHAHNYYLNIFAETGAVGLTVYLLLFVLIFNMVWKARIHPDHTSRYTAIGLLGTWVYLAAHSLTDNLYVNNIFIHIGIMVGLTLCLYDEIIGTAKDR